MGVICTNLANYGAPPCTIYKAYVRAISERETTTTRHQDLVRVLQVLQVLGQLAQSLRDRTAADQSRLKVEISSCFRR